MWIMVLVVQQWFRRSFWAKKFTFLHGSRQQATPTIDRSGFVRHANKL